MSIPISVIICTRNRAGHLYETLQSVGHLRIPDHLDPELLVVDNGSTDCTGAVLKDPPVKNMRFRSLVEPKIGASRARNAALRVANGRILMWLDDDVRVPSGWLHHMTRPILEKEADAVAGRVMLAPHLQRSWMEPFHRSALAATGSMESKEPRSIISANMAFSRTVLTEIPGFDPELGPGQLGTMEDVLFSWQLRKAGFRTETVQKAAVEHHFERERLTRSGFTQAAVKRGQSLSYIQYHWLHHAVENWTHQEHVLQAWRHPYFVLAKRFIDWQIRRWIHLISNRSGPITKREFWALMNAYSIKQYLNERERPRNYLKKGLSKIHGKQPLTVVDDSD